MKWMFIGLFFAAMMVGAGFLLTDTGPGGNLSHNAEAARIFALGSDQVQAFKFIEGAKNLETALELDPSMAEAAISLAMAYWRLGRGKDYKNVLSLADSLTTYIQSDDRRMLAQMRLGLHHQSRFSGMIDSLMTRLEKEQPDNIHVMVTAAKRLAMQGRKDQEFEAWHSILEKNPNYAEAYNLLGYLEMNRGRYQKAVEHMKKYAFLAPNLANPHDSLGEVLMVMGQYEDAAGEFRAAIALQPDFHFSYINLGRSYLYRGMVKSGLDIMNQVQEMVAGSDLGQAIDQSLVFTYLEMEMAAEIAQMTRTYVERYPDHDLSPYFRAIRLAHMNQLPQSQTLMDSTLAAWRTHEVYHANPKVRSNVDLAEKQYEGYLADLAEQPSTRIRKWNSVVTAMADNTPLYRIRSARITLARAYLDNDEALKAQDEIVSILEANNRLIPALILAVETDLALGKAQQARLALEQLKWSIQQSDDDFYGRGKAELLEGLVIVLEGKS